MISNIIPTNPPKWLKQFFKYELILAGVLLLFTLLISIVAIYAGLKSLGGNRSLFAILTPIANIYIFCITYILFIWIPLSIYSKLIMKSWKPLITNYKVALFSLPFLSSILGVLSLPSFRMPQPQSWEFYLPLAIWLAISTLLFYGLLYGVLVLYSNFRKTTSTPWFNLIHIPLYIIFTVLFTLPVQFEDINDAISRTVSNIFNFGIFPIPILFIIFLYLEYRAIKKLTIQK